MAGQKRTTEWRPEGGERGRLLSTVLLLHSEEGPGGEEKKRHHRRCKERICSSQVCSHMIFLNRIAPFVTALQSAVVCGTCRLSLLAGRRVVPIFDDVSQ